ncbi:MAG: tetratricopeptide repeat protein, partial [Rikenellaceae bacterium]
AYFNRALVHASSNRPMNAISDFNKVVALDSTNSLTYFNRALLLSQIGDYNKAMDDYNKVATYSPNNVLVYFNRGMLNNQLGNVEGAEKDFTKAIELYPDFANAYLSRSNVRYRVGNMTGSKSDHDIATKKIQEYKTKMLDSTFSSYADTSKMFNSLLSFDVDFGNKDFENITNTNLEVKLEPMYRYTSATEPDKVVGYAYKNPALQLQKSALKDYGLLLVSLKDQHSEDKIKELSVKVNKLLLKDPKNEILEFALGAADHALRQYTNAIKYYSAAIEKSPSNPFYYMSRAVANAEMTEFVAQIDNKNHKLLVDADPVNQLKNTQKIYNYDRALEDINQAIKLNPKVAHFYYNRAHILYLSGDLVSAINDYTKAIDLYPFMADAYFNRGIIQVRLKETKKGFLDISHSGELGNTNAYDVLKRYGKLLNK